MGNCLIRTFLAAFVALLPASAYAQTPPTYGPVDTRNFGSVPFTATGGTTAITEADRAARSFFLDDFYLPADGTDYSPSFSRAMTACTNAGGGSVRLLGKQYRLATGGTIPTSCSLVCPAPLLGNANPTNYQTAPFVLRVPSASTITMNTGSGWYGCAELMDGITTGVPTTIRNLITMIAAFAGTGITTNALGSDVVIRDAFIGGFATGIHTERGARDRFENVNIDSSGGNCILTNNSQDPSSYKAIHCRPFLTVGYSFTTSSYAISAIADNGSGLYRVTLATNSVITGDTVWVSGMAGAQSAGNKWTATVIDTTHIDLQSSHAAGVTPTGTTVSTSPVITGLSSLAGIATGDTISGSGIPGGTTIAAVFPRMNAIALSANATASASGVTLTIADAAYVSGGNLYLDASQRSGTGIVYTQTATATCEMCFVYGHSIGFEIGTTASWVSLLGPAVDNNNALADPTTIGFLIDGASTGTSVVGGSTQSVGEAVVINTTGNGPHSFVGVQLNNNNGPVIELVQGAVSFVGNATPPATKAIGVGTAMVSSSFAGNNMMYKPYFQSAASVNQFFGAANAIAATNVFQGVLNQQGPVFLGNGGSCGEGITGSVCQTSIRGALSETAQTIGIGATTGVTVSPSGNVINVWLASSVGAITSMTLSLPSAAFAGMVQSYYFDNAVTTLTLSGGSEVGFPTTIAANSWHKCTVDASAAKWLCQ